MYYPILTERIELMHKVQEVVVVRRCDGSVESHLPD